MSSLGTRRPKVGLIALGCPKNLVDAEVMLGALQREGFEVTNQPAAADVLIVNTCSFIAAAREESITAILESARTREARKRGQALIVAGCLPQRFGDDLPRLLPEVDAFMGLDQVGAVADIVNQALARRAGRPRGPRAPAPVTVNRPPRYLPDAATPRFRLTPRHLAYLKIAEGCNHACSFCAIPRIRGRHRSRPWADLLEEARRRLAEGVKELNLISQDSTFYGLDWAPITRRAGTATDRSRAASRARSGEALPLCSLLRALNDLPGDFWIRLLYTHPAHWTDELIQTIAECRKVVRYVDIPLQHIHAEVLARMRRRTSPRLITDLLRRIRAGIPGVVLRTTFIVGFPGETEEHFEGLLEFIRTTRFERLGVFAYSPEEGTLAAGMAPRVPERVRQRRRARAMAVQQQVAREVSAAYLGRTLRVLVEGRADVTVHLLPASVVAGERGSGPRRQAEATLSSPRDYSVARGEGDAPDIDGRVYVRGRLPVGEFASVRILGHTEYDLFAEPAQE